MDKAFQISHQKIQSSNNFIQKLSEYEQEITQSHTADQPTAP